MMIPYLSREEYGRGLAVGIDLLAEAFATEFNVGLEASEQRPLPITPEARRPGIPGGWLFILLVILIVITRGRILLLPFLLGSTRGWGRRSGWGGGGFGGGFGGGGFGGFGGGGGFSGGGAGGRF
jgi:uncharacterized protein